MLQTQRNKIETVNAKNKEFLGSSLIAYVSLLMSFTDRHSKKNVCLSVNFIEKRHLPNMWKSKENISLSSCKNQQLIMRRKYNIQSINISCITCFSSSLRPELCCES